MKKSYLLLTPILLLSLGITGCQSSSYENKETESVRIQMSDSNEYIAGEDGCNNFLMDGINPEIIPYESGYYFRNNFLLHYYDTSTNKTVVVCSKPDCNHGYEDNCAARIETSANDIFCYQNNLYVITSNFDENNVNSFILTQISVDGSEREDLFSFVHITGEEISYEAYVHRGYFYYSIANLDGSKKEKLTIYRRALVKDAPEEVFYESEAYGGDIGCIRGYGNEIYFDESGFKSPDSDEYMELKKCNIHTKEAETVRENHYGYYEKIEDKLYYFDKAKEMLIEYSESTKETRELCKVEKMAETDLKSDGQYLYLYCFNWKSDTKQLPSKKRLQILDVDGNLVDTLENTDEFIGGDENYLFFKGIEDVYSEEAKQETSIEHVYYYKKSDIGSGDYSLRTEIK